MVVGRTLNSVLTLGPLIFELVGILNNWNLLAQGTLAGAFTGGAGHRFRAPILLMGQNVPNLAEVGFPES